MSFYPKGFREGTYSTMLMAGGGPQKVNRLKKGLTESSRGNKWEKEKQEGNLGDIAMGKT